MNTPQKPLSSDEAILPTSHKVTTDVRAWQAAKIKTGIKAADAGRFASSESVKAVVRKFIPNG
jgi:predicted transcriptional regulator